MVWHYKQIQEMEEHEKANLIFLEVSWYSLEQYIGCIIRQAFNYCCSLLQVWREVEKQALIWHVEA